MTSKRKNILLIMSDQQRLDTISAYGKDCICKTPNIDAIAENGVKFTNAFTPSAVCSPARASLFTGLYPHNHGITGNGGILSESTNVLSKYLIKANYSCGYSGKWHVDEQKGPTEYGFEGADFMGYGFPGSKFLPGLVFDLAPYKDNAYKDYLIENDFEIPSVKKSLMGKNPTNQVQEMYALHDGPLESTIDYYVAYETNRLIEKMSKKDEPFFMWANFWGPHSPSLVPEPYYSMYHPNDIKPYPSYKETFINKPYSHELTEKLWGLGDYGWEGFQQIAARYFGHCSLIDDMVGLIVKKLKDLGILDDTIIIYTADHGDCMGAHKLIEKGCFMYDEIYNIPMIISNPDCINKGSSNDDFVYLHDLYPTILDAAGTEEPYPNDGESFLDQTKGTGISNNRNEVFCAFNTHFFPFNQRMIRTRTHQFTFNSSDRGELYDLEKDPFQLKNVYNVKDYQAVKKDLINTMEFYMQKYNDPVYNWFSRVKGVY